MYKCSTNINSILFPTLGTLLIILLLKASYIPEIEGMGDNRDNMEQVQFDKDKEMWARQARELGGDEYYNQVLAMPNVSQAKEKYKQLYAAYKKERNPTSESNLTAGSGNLHYTGAVDTDPRRSGSLQYTAETVDNTSIKLNSWGDGSSPSRVQDNITKQDADLKAPWAKAAFNLGQGNRQDYADEVMATVSENAAIAKYHELLRRQPSPYGTIQNDSDTYIPHDGPVNANEASNSLYAAHDTPGYIGNLDKNTIIDPPGILGPSSLMPQQPRDGGTSTRPINITITSNVGPYGYVESQQQPSKMKLKHAIGEKTAKQLVKNLDFMEFALAQSKSR